MCFYHLTCPFLIFEFYFKLNSKTLYMQLPAYLRFIKAAAKNPLDLASPSKTQQNKSSSRSSFSSSEPRQQRHQRPVTTKSPENSEQRVERQRQKAGSGTLMVSVLLDGPTRVLRISDFVEQRPFPSISRM